MRRQLRPANTFLVTEDRNLTSFEKTRNPKFSKIIFRPDGAGGVLFGITDQMRRKTRFGIEYLKLSSSNKYRINLLWIPEDASEQVRSPTTLIKSPYTPDNFVDQQLLTRKSTKTASKKLRFDFLLTLRSC